MTVFRNSTSHQPPRRVNGVVGPTDMRIWVLAMLVATFASGALADGERLTQWQWAPGNCPHGLHQAPQGPFAIFLHCEDALGVYLSVVWYAPMGAPATVNGRWSLERRYWEDGLWGSDITGFKWSKDGLKLVVSTSPVYGSGGLFELNLEDRTCKQKLPKSKAVSGSEPGPGYDISGKQLEPPQQQ